MAPQWLAALATVSLIASIGCSLVIAADILAGRKQKMVVMNFVWPITALWSGPIGLFVYWSLGRAGKRRQSPFWRSVLVSDTHCGAGCTVGDFAGEWFVYLSSLTIAGSVLWANYAIDFLLAYLVGIGFQYFSIAPMRGISGWPAIKVALKADTISLIAFEIGMFAWMALSAKVLFHPALEPAQPAYWFSMQIAMFVGFVTAYPANWWLIRQGLKEAM